MNFKERYGPVALVAGASEGLGAAWATAFAKRGMDLILIARRKEPLERLAKELSEQYSIQAIAVPCDLGADNAVEQITQAIGNTGVNLLVYNAALPFIGSFIEKDADMQVQIAKVNMITPIRLTHYLGRRMVEKGKGGIILMSSLAGFQGSGFLATYAATKAFNRILAEGLWYEWKDKGVDVIGCCAGATSTPNYINTQPQKTGLLKPPVQSPEGVVEECLGKLGKVPSYITGTGNRLACFVMNKLLTRKMAVNIMGDTTRKMYGV